MERYFRAEMPDDDASAVLKHILHCDQCEERARRVLERLESRDLTAKRIREAFRRGASRVRHRKN